MDNPEIGYKASNDMEIEHINCPNLYCSERNVPTCENGCPNYSLFIAFVNKSADEVF
jgi:hypothetical protein